MATGFMFSMGGGGGGVSVTGGSGTTNRVSKFTSATTLGNSLLSDDGTNVTLVSGSLNSPLFNGLVITNNGTNTLNIAAGVTLTSPAVSASISGVLYSSASVAGVGNSTTVETTLDTYTLPASALNANGKILRISAFGTLAANGNSKTFKVYFGSTVISTKTFVNQGTWNIEGRVIRASATTQVSLMRCGVNSTNAGNENINGPDFEAPTETLSDTVIIKVTGSSSAASNDILLKGFVIEVLN